jgi:hypothetical protein
VRACCGKRWRLVILVGGRLIVGPNKTRGKLVSLEGWWVRRMQSVQGAAGVACQSGVACQAWPG